MSIFYLDSSALLKPHAEEVGSAWVRRSRLLLPTRAC